MSRLRVLQFGAALACLSASAVAGAQDPEPIDRFLGTWDGRGELFGTEAAFIMNWERVLEGRFVRLMFSNSMQGEQGVQPVLSAHAYYRQTGCDSYEADWYDTRGVRQPVVAMFENGTLTANWGTSDTEMGRTVYRLTGDNDMEVVDYVMRDGQYQIFGRARYARTDGSK